MYYILNQIMNPNQIAMIGVLVAFILTFLGLKFPFSFLPVDHGREFAVNGALSKGKTRGVGLTFVYANGQRVYYLLHSFVCNDAQWLFG